MTDIKQHKSLESLNDVFKIPICYNTKVRKLNNTVVNDLELIQTKEPNELSIYQHVFNPSNKPSLKILGCFFLIVIHMQLIDFFLWINNKCNYTNICIGCGL